MPPRAPGLELAAYCIRHRLGRVRLDEAMAVGAEFAAMATGARSLGDALKKTVVVSSDGGPG